MLKTEQYKLGKHLAQCFIGIQETISSLEHWNKNELLLYL